MLLQLPGNEKNLGGFTVRRLLPSAARHSVGPFVFLDHLGPADFEPGTAIDVRPHPHIGLATVTYLFEGAIIHRDSLNSVQRIEPGAINWMSAGRGIVHSERTPPDLRTRPHRVHGLQLWVGLPQDMEDSEPAFHHTPAGALAPFPVPGADVRLLIGAAFGRRSPVRTASPTLFLIMSLKANVAFELPVLADEIALYPMEGGIEVGQETLAQRTLGVLDGEACVLKSHRDVTVAVIGGAPIGPRTLWWNFVASSPSRIVAAADAWREQRLGSVAGEIEFIPLPENVPTL